MKVDLSFLYRKKKYDQTDIQNTQLDRVLGLVDITALGVSCTLGNGIYVLAGLFNKFKTQFMYIMRCFLFLFFPIFKKVMSLQIMQDHL
jgi:hypothetical protein